MQSAKEKVSVSKYAQHFFKCHIVYLKTLPYDCELQLYTIWTLYVKYWFLMVVISIFMLTFFPSDTFSGQSNDQKIVLNII